MAAIRAFILVLCIAGLSGTAFAQGRGVSPDGHEGTIHKVVQGDTLWDLANTYLGTPWVWPSIWKENTDIQNPHLIHPGDLIWITDREMRKLTPEEAERLMAGLPLEGDSQPAEPEPTEDRIPAARDRAPAEPEVMKGPEYVDPFAALDQGDSGLERKLSYSGLDRYSFVSDAELNASGTVMGHHEQNYWSSQEQRTIVSVGEGQAHTGDALTVFRVRRRVLHPETGEVLGYFIQVLGRAEVMELHPESSFVKIVEAYGEIQPGDRVVAYEEQPEEIPIVHAEEGMRGQVVAYQPYRLRSGEGDFVVLDRGTAQGVVTGNQFEIFRAGREVRDPHTLNKVLVPDDIVGELFVVKSSENTSLALLTRSRNEILIGDHFRSSN